MSPLYNYFCKECKTDFEDILRLSECEDPQKCPACGEMAERVFSPCKTFILKGWGWSGDNYEGVEKERWRQKNVFNKDGSLISQEGKKNDWDEKLIFDMGEKKTLKKETKSGRKRIK